MEEKEIDLAGIFQVIRRRKRILLVVSLGAMVVGIIVSFLSPKIYEAKVTLMVMKPKGISPSGGGFGYSIDTYRGLIKNDKVKNLVIEELKLKDHKIDLSTLDKMIRVEQIRESELLMVSVEDKDPILAKDIVNRISEIAVSENQKIVDEQMTNSQDFLYQQVWEAEKRVKAADDRLLEFKKKANLDILKKEIEIKLQEKSKFEIAYSDLKIEEKEKEAKLREIKNQLDKRERLIVTSRSLVEDSALQQIVAKVTDSELQSVLNLKMESEEVNNTYQELDREYAVTLVSLAGLRANLENLERHLKKNEKELAILNKELAEKERCLGELQREHSLAMNAYSLLSSNYEGSQIVEASKIGVLKIISSALTPERPIKPKKRLIVAVSGLLGLMGGITCVALLEYQEKKR